MLNDLIDNWKQFMQNSVDANDVKMIRKHINTGRPLGSSLFIERLEKLTGRSLKKKKPGPQD